MPALHAKKGPSGAKKFHECPGSLAYAGSLPVSMRGGSSPAARFGTAAHLLLEMSLANRVEPRTFEGRLIVVAAGALEGEEPEETVMLKPRAKTPKNPEERGRTYEVNDEMIMNVDTAWVYITGRVEELGTTLNALQIETRTNPCPERNDTWGTADVTIEGEVDFLYSALEVVDYKNGRLTVEHKANPQLLAYLAGRAEDTGWRHDLYFITVIQPNGRHEDGKVRRIPVTKAELQAFVEAHREAAIKADLAADEFYECDQEVKTEHGRAWADKWLKAGDHCTFCDAGPICPIKHAWVTNMARQSSIAEFAAFIEKDPETELQIEAVEQAKAILRWRHVLLPQFKAAERFLNTEASAGRVPAEWKLVRSRSYARWRPDEDGVVPDTDTLAYNMFMDGLISAERYTAGLYAPRETLSGPETRKLVPSKRRAEFNAKYLYTPPGKLKLVPEDAPGVAVVFDAKADFAEFLDEEEQEY